MFYTVTSYSARYGSRDEIIGSYVHNDGTYWFYWRATMIANAIDKAYGNADDFMVCIESTPLKRRIDWYVGSVLGKINSFVRRFRKSDDLPF